MATYKDTRRDKFKHSDAALNKQHGDAKKGGAGRHGWGKPGDELKAANMDSRDPNYDSGAEAEEDAMWVPVTTEPSEHVSRGFTDLFERSNRFKKAVAAALREYLVSGNKDEFLRCVLELDLSQWHHEIAKICIIHALDLAEDQRPRVSLLLDTLAHKQVVRAVQMETAFHQVFNRLGDLVLDSPSAETVLRDLVQRAVIGGSLSEAAAHAMLDGAERLRDPAQVGAAKKQVAELVNEYLANGEVAEAERRVQELKDPHFHHFVVKQLISLAMDRSNRERELASHLLAVLSGGALRSSEVEKGFDMLLFRVDDLIKDVPKVLELLATFLARAVVDECLPPAYLSRTILPPDDLGGKVVKQAEALLGNTHAWVRLQSVWGPGDGRPVADLKKVIYDTIAELFESGDVTEAARCLRELAAPHFLHEAVKRLMVMAADHKQREQELAVALLRRMLTEGILSVKQYSIGVERVTQSLKDLELDAPGATAVVDLIKQQVAQPTTPPASAAAVASSRATGAAVAQ